MLILVLVKKNLSKIIKNLIKFIVYLNFNDLLLLMIYLNYLL